jgi:glutaredoxin
MTLKRTLDNAKIRYTLIGVDTDDGVNIATANGVKSVPTLIYNGKRLTGVCNEATVRKLMEVEE